MKSGTSMSTPFVSGAVALALEKDPLLTNVEIKMMLKDSADAVSYTHLGSYKIRLTYTFKRRASSGNSFRSHKHVTGTYGNDLSAASRRCNAPWQRSLISCRCHDHQPPIP